MDATQSYLKNKWDNLSREFEMPESSEEFWSEIVGQYSKTARSYHNLNHLCYLFQKWESCDYEVEDPMCMSLSIFYHDIVYDVRGKQNEILSADLAVDRLKVFGVSPALQQKCKHQILSTEKHVRSNDEDTNFFLDLDLGILGESNEDYMAYSKKIRQEYKMYPDILYKPGRKKVLKHFLGMDKIFKTSEFLQKYEQRARENMEIELRSL